MGGGITERLAGATARHANRTLAVWVALVVAACVLVATSLHGLTSSTHVDGRPQSTVAADLYAQGFPSVGSKSATDVIVIGSNRYTASAPTFRSYVAALAAKVRATGKVESVGSYLTGAGPVSANGHAALIELVVGSDAGAKPSRTGRAARERHRRVHGRDHRRATPSITTSARSPRATSSTESSSSGCRPRSSC